MKNIRQIHTKIFIVLQFATYPAFGFHIAPIRGYSTLQRPLSGDRDIAMLIYFRPSVFNFIISSFLKAIITILLKTLKQY